MRLKRRALVLLCGVLACLHAVALAGDFGTVVVDGRDADRVHLRARPAAGAESLGLYFTGTEAVSTSDPAREWVAVTIGAQAGYMKADYLRSGAGAAGVQAQQPQGIVQGKSADSWVNLRGAPSLQAAVVGRCSRDEAVTILGETATHWYYVKAGEQYGYMLADYVAMGAPTSPAAPAAPPSLTGEVEMLRYAAAPNGKSSISIQYPRFPGSSAAALNARVEAKVQAMARQPYQLHGEDAGITLDYQCAVTLYNRRIASMVFWGWSHVENSAHPFTDLVAYNIDLTTMQEVTLAELYRTDAAFEAVFFEKALFPQNPNTSYTARQFPEMLALQAEQSAFRVPGDCACFLTPEGAVFSMSAIHATGSDHFEGLLRYGDSQPFYLPAQKYWED